MRVRISNIWIFCCLLGFISQVQATYIDRTVTMDGDMSDWYDTDANTYDPAGDITNNSGQYSEDLENGTGDLDEPLTSTGRDLKKFSFTWDDTYLYFYVERWASSTNVTDWWFYIDSTTNGDASQGPDGYMQSGEKVLRVTWQGNTRSTVAKIYDYVESASGGDPLTNGGVGDGYTMPGDISNATDLYNTSYGASSGTEMETILAWTSVLGLTGPASIKFHISSSNGSNIPNNIIDNMDGPAGGQLFPVDLEVTKTASVSSIRGLQTFSYTVSVFNGSLDPFTGVQITDNLPAQVTYNDPDYTASTGTYSSGVWSIPSIASNTAETLTINVTANSLPISMNVGNTATLTASTPADENAANDASTVTVTIIPIPLLTIVKSTSGGVTNADPGTILTYQIVVTNTGGEAGERIEITDHISPYERLKVDIGTGAPFSINWGTSGLTNYTPSYSTDGSSYAHSLATSPSVYDDAVTHFKLTMDVMETMSIGGSFTIQYQTQVR